MSLTSSSITAGHSICRDTIRELGDKSINQSCPSYFRWRNIADFAIAALVLIPAGAVIAVLVLLVRATSKGPGIYQQVRVGKNGLEFMMYKIRTMRIDAEKASGPVWTQPRDPRVTRLGLILRKLHLDELPQIFNVLRGEMSFIGPRPERPEFVHVLTGEIPGYQNRLAIRPGVTGLAQINLPPDTTVESVRDKLSLDLEYIRTGGTFLDLRIYLCTLLRMFGVRGTLPAKAMGLWFAPQIPELRAKQNLGSSLHAPHLSAAHGEPVSVDDRVNTSQSLAGGRASVHVVGAGHARHESKSGIHGKKSRHREIPRHAK